MKNVIPLWRRRRSDLRPVPTAPELKLPAVSHTRAAIHWNVPITALVEALAERGMTLSNHPQHGLVIHLMSEGAA